jgi:hypothetical protein
MDLANDIETFVEIGTNCIKMKDFAAQENGIEIIIILCTNTI